MDIGQIDVFDYPGVEHLLDRLELFRALNCNAWIVVFDDTDLFEIDWLMDNIPEFDLSWVNDKQLPNGGLLVIKEHLVS